MANPPRGAMSSPFAGWGEQLAKADSSFTVYNTVNLADEREKALKAKKEQEESNKKIVEEAAMAKVNAEPTIITEHIPKMTVDDIQKLFTIIGNSESCKVTTFNDQFIEFTLNGKIFDVRLK